MALVEVDRSSDAITVLTLNDPDRRNAMTAAMGEVLRDVVAELTADEQVRAVVLTGAGDAFSAGGDIAMLDALAAVAHDMGADVAPDMRAFYDLFLSLRGVPVPLVAAVNGHAIGAGLCVALACDLVVVADGARLGMNFARVGIHPGMGGSWLLPRIAGRQRAAELLYTGRLITGADAVAYGMALEALPAADVLPRALALAAAIAASAPQVVRQLKQSLDATWTRTLDEQLAAEAGHQAVNFASDDVLEGLAAARERRDPRFAGR